MVILRRKSLLSVSSVAIVQYPKVLTTKQKYVFMLNMIHTRSRTSVKFICYLLITTLLVLMLATTVVTANSHTEKLENNNTYFAGESLEYTTNQTNLSINNTSIEVQNTSGDVILEPEPLDSDTVVFDTESLSSEVHVLVIENASEQESVPFNVTQQTLSASVEPEEVLNTNSSTSNLTLDSNRENYEVEIGSENLTQDTLENIFDVSGDNDTDTVVLSDKNTSNISFSSLEKGEYSFDISVTDTNATANTSFEVFEPGDESSVFKEANYTVSGGDNANIQLNLTLTNNVTVTIGDESQGYEAEISALDSDNDGDVSFDFSTFLAGQADEVVSSDGDTASLETQTTFNNSSERIDTGMYNLTVSIYQNGTQTQTDSGQIEVQEPELRGVETYKIPRTEMDIDYNYLTERTPSSTIASGDKLVLEFNATGLYSVLDTYELDSATNLSVNSTLDQDLGMLVRIQGDSVNETVESELLSSGDVYYQESDSQLFVVTDTDEFSFITGSYTAELQMKDSNPYVNNRSNNISNNFTIEDVFVNFTSVDSNRTIVYNKSGDVELNGRTNLANGTRGSAELSLLDDATSRSLGTSNTTVNSGQFETTISGSELPRSGTVDVEFDNTNIEGVILEIPPEEYVLDSSMIDEEQQGLEGTITVRNEDNESVVDSATSTNQESFRLDRDQYTVLFESDGYSTQSQNVSLNQNSELVADMRLKTYRLTVNTVDSNGAEIASNITVDGERSISQTTVTEQVENGVYQVSANKTGFSESTRNVTVQGQDKEVKLSLEEDSGLLPFNPLIGGVVILLAVSVVAYIRTN